MRANFALTLLFAAVAYPAAATADAEFSSYYGGKRYDFKISQARQLRCPKWDPEKDANPPVSAATALGKAKGFMAGLSTPWMSAWSVTGNPTAGISWSFEDLALVEVSGGWAWRARFRLNPDGYSAGRWPTMDCWILTDGTRVEPVITEAETR